MKKLFFLLVFFAHSGLMAQLHKHLDSVEVFAQKSVADIQLQEVDSTVLQFAAAENLGDVLQKHSAINVNVNGFFGQVSSPSSGGLGSDHVKIHWEGVELNQLTLGSFDLSLFPTFLADAVSVNSGADFNTLGGNASGLGVNIRSVFRNTNSLTFGFGSFGHYRTSAKISQRVGKSVFVLQPYAISSQNNFEYQEKGPRDVQTKISDHNALQQSGFMANVNLGPKIKAGMWLQNRKKQLPPTLQQNGASSALQLDNNYRVFARYNPNTHWEWQADFSKDGLRYRDKLGNEPKYSINSDIHIQRLGNHLRYRVYARKFKFQAHSQVLHYTVNSSGFANTVQQWRTQNQLSVEYKNKRWYGRLASKIQGIEGQAWRNTIMGSVAYVYRNTALSYGINQRFKAPDFNDLYWANGGNPELKNEEGWSHYLLLKHEAEWRAELKVSHTELQNKIQWVPNGNNWSPINISQLRSFAIDVRGGKLWKWNALLFEASAYANRSVANEFDEGQAEYSQEQVIFLPRYKTGAQFNLQAKAWKVLVSVYGMSKRYTDRGNQEIFALASYHSLDAGLSRKLLLGDVRGTLQLQVNNALNNTELLAPSRPNPGRYYRCSITLDF